MGPPDPRAAHAPHTPSPRRRVATALACSSLAFTTTSDGTGTGSVLEQEQLFISAGCPSDTPGTCTSVRWLGTSPGDATSNFLTAMTPADEVLYQVDGVPNWRDYPGDKSVGQYSLSGDPLEAVVVLSGDGVGAQTVVESRVRVKVDGSWKLIPTETQTVVVLPNEPTEVTLPFDVSAYAGQVLTNITFEIAVRGINLYSGRIDQEGGSTVTIPHLVEATEAA